MEKRERDAAARIATETRRARKARGWSQAELAERAELSVNYVSLIERAEQIPSVEVLLRLADVLGTSIVAFVAEQADTDPWLVETAAILRALPDAMRPAALGALRGLADATILRTPQKAETSSVRHRRTRKPRRK